MKLKQPASKIQKIINILKRYLQHFAFKLKNPNVKLINPKNLGRYYSQEGQDIYLSSLLFNLLDNDQEKYILDIGCNHPKKYSNSLFFERYFRCKTIAVDPIPTFKETWKKERPTAAFVSTALGEHEGVVTLNIPANNSGFDNMFSSTTKNNPKIGESKSESLQVPCTTLTNILEQFEIREVVIASIDVEGAEMSVLKGIDFSKTKINCFVIENNTNNLYGDQKLRTYLKSKSYNFVARIGYLDDVFLHTTVLSQQ